MHRRYKPFIIMFLFMLLLTACGDQMEIDRITFPIVMGIDWDETKQMINVYAQVSTLSSQSGGGVQTEKTFKVIQGHGKTLSKAMLDTTDHAQQNISWKHVIAVVLTKKVAEHGISDLLDHLCRFAEIHINAYFLITTDNLEDLLGTAPKIESGLSSPIAAISLINEQNTHSRIITIKDYVTSYLSQEIEPTLPLITIYKFEKSQKDTTIEFDYKGLGVFKKDKLVGWLTENETRSLNFFFGTENKGSIAISQSEKNTNTEYTVHDISAKTLITPTLQKNKPSFSIRMTGDFDLGESTSRIPLDVEGVKKIETQVDNFMKKELEGIIKKAQKELKADIFGFGGRIYRKYPDFWYKNKGRWESIFSEAAVNIEVQLQLNDTDELSSSLKSKIKSESNASTN